MMTQKKDTRAEKGKQIKAQQQAKSAIQEITEIK